MHSSKELSPILYKSILSLFDSYLIFNLFNFLLAYKLMLVILPSSKIVSSLEALLASIENDDQVFRWFIFLILQPQVKSELIQDQSLPLFYRKLKILSILNIVLLISVLAYLLWLYFHPKIVFLLATGIFFSPYTEIIKHKRTAVVNLSRHLLERDFPDEELRQKTLYQIAEHYARQYAIPSLVDTIFALDNIARLTLIFGFVFTAFIYPLKFWEIFIGTLLLYVVVMTLVRSDLIYKFLK